MEKRREMREHKHLKQEPFAEESETTARKRITDLLKERGWDARELSRAVGIPQREVETHLKHVARSVSAHGGRLEVESPQCRDCGFGFGERDRTTKPSRCPKCRSEHIAPPVFRIR